jgi:hypothetical protein
MFHYAVFVCIYIAYFHHLCPSVSIPFPLLPHTDHSLDSPHFTVISHYYYHPCFLLLLEKNSIYHHPLVSMEDWFQDPCEYQNL